MFASTWRESDGETAVLLTARDAEAKKAARSLLGTVAKADWTHGWRDLELGDALIELHLGRVR